MKNAFKFTLVLVLFSTVGISQQVSDKNWTLIHERTATWCPYCGTWGWEMKDQILSKYTNSNVIYMAVHHSGDLTNSTADEFGNNFSGTGQPIFYVDGVNVNVNSGNISQKMSETQLEIDFKDSTSVIAGVGLDATLGSVSKTLNVKAKVEFLNDVEGGDYYLGLYLMEDVQNIQAERSGLQLHKNVLRQSLLPTTFGNALKSGAIAKGTSFTVNASALNISIPREKLKIVGIIWAKVNGKYLFFNANQVNVAIPAASSDEMIPIKEFNVFQSENGSVNIDLKNIKPATNTFLNVLDLSGKIISTQMVKSEDFGNIIEITGKFKQGMHIITLIGPNDQLSRKILLK